MKIAEIYHISLVTAQHSCAREKMLLIYMITACQWVDSKENSLNHDFYPLFSHFGPKKAVFENKHFEKKIISP